MESMIGKIIDNYRIVKKLGEGGMGVVYKAIDMTLDREVALKMLTPVMAGESEFLKRFIREARSLARIDDPNIVSVYAFKKSEAGTFIVMQYIDGITLADLLKKRGKIPWQPALHILKQILTAIGHAHREGVFHRDLKPSNVLLTRPLKVKITDFGLAKIAQDPDITVTTTRAGTLKYMSPEQLIGLKEANNLSDIYSIGIIFYEILVGKTPFYNIDSEYEIQQRIVKGKIPSPTKVDSSIHLPLAKISLKAINKNPTKRFQSTDEMLYEIKNFETQQRISSTPIQQTSSSKRPLTPILISSLFAFVLLLFVIIYLSNNLPEPEEVNGPGSQETSVQYPDNIEVIDINEIFSGSVPPNIQITHIMNAVKQEKLHDGDKLIRIALIKKSTYWNQKYNVAATLFWREIGLNRDYIVLYVGPVAPELSLNEIIQNYKLKDLDINIKQVLVEQLNLYQQEVIMTVDNFLPL